MKNDDKKIERFYRMKHGLIFKHNEETMKFFVLNEWFEWEENRGLISIFYDASSDYIEILNPLSDPTDEILKLISRDKSD